MFVIETASIDDLDELSEVFRLASLSNEGDRPHLLEHPEALVFPERSVRAGYTRKAVEDGRIVGLATAVPDGAELELEDLFVHPDRRREGVALALVRDIVVRAGGTGIERLVVTANPHALPFYRRAGFAHDGVTTTEFGPATRMVLHVE